MSAAVVSRHRRNVALAAALIAVGCSGGAGGGCSNSCGGAFRTVDDQGRPYRFTGPRLDNVAQVRVTQSGLNFLDAQHLNDILGALNQGASSALHIPCVGPFNALAATGVPACTAGVQANILAGDTNFDGACEAGESTPISVTFKNVAWSLDAANNQLHAHVVSHVKTGDIYIRTVEAHSCICGLNGNVLGDLTCANHEYAPIQARMFYDDEQQGLLPQDQDTNLDLTVQLTTTPDGRLEFNFDDASLSSLVTNFHPAALWGPDGFAGTNPPPPSAGSFTQDGCDSPTAARNYAPTDGNGNLTCAALFRGLTAGCHPDATSTNGILCSIFLAARSYAFDAIKNALKTQITNVLRTQLDNVRCQRATDTSGKTVACDATNGCPLDDDGHQLTCDTARGVCLPYGQTAGGTFNCEPIPLAVQGTLDVSGMSQKVGFPAGTSLAVFAGLGSKTGGAKIDANGLTLAAEAGTQAASAFQNLCAPPAQAPAVVQPPPLDFDDPGSKPAGVTAYDVGLALSSTMLNRGFYDAYNAGMLCVAITNRTTAFISSGLFKNFLPSLGLVTGGKDAPMAILLRPTQPPTVRVGQGAVSVDGNGTVTLGDPLITLGFKQMNLDFYALIEERQVRLFTLQADLQVPLSLRTFADPQSDTLQPVLGSLDQVLTNISALSPDGGAYGAADLLAEDPGVVKDLLGAAVRLAQPQLAGVLKPVALPSMLGLKLGVEGVAGAVPFADVANNGFNHLAVWTRVNDCLAGGCGTATVKTAVQVASADVPATLAEVRAGARPVLRLNVSAATRGGAAEYSYRVDGSLWSPWMRPAAGTLTLRDPLFLVQGHHLIEVTAREPGDDHTMDPEPAAVDFFVSYEAPAAKLVQRPDGAVMTSARSAASGEGALLYSYRVDGESGWTQPGPARVFTPAELRGRGLTVSVSDEAGRATTARFGDEL